MNKVSGVNDFLNRLTEYYSASFKNESDKELWKDYTLDEIYNPNVDYDKLLKLLIRRAHNGNFVPDSKQINEDAKECYKATAQKKWLHVKVFNPLYKAVTNTDCFPAGTSEEAMLRAYNTIYPSKEWKIIKIV